jgi:hypothetical protein
MRKNNHKNRIIRAISETLEARALFDVTPISFSSSVSFVAGTGPDAIASADFNGDGNADLAVADQSAHKVNVFFGNGAGAFSAGPVLALSAAPVAIITGDFNGDGKPDIAVATTAGDGASGSAVDVFLNNGDGTFGLGQITAIQANSTAGDPVALAAADFNKDGHLDLAVSIYSVSGVGAAGVMIGTGNGSFSTPTLYPVNGFATGIAAGEFNGDSNADLAVASTSVDIASGAKNDGTASNTISTFLGDGLGNFTPGAAGATLSTSGVLDSLSTINLTASNTLGLLAGSTDGTVTVIPNTGGSFNTSAIATVAGGTGVTAVGDFNLDGIPDFVSANGGGLYPFNSVTVVPGIGSGGIGTSQDLAVGSSPVGVVVADFNNDGKPDIASVNENDGTVSVLLNTTAVTQVASRTTLASDNASVPAGSTVTLTATVNGVSVSPLAGESIPTGTVYFYDGSALLGSSALVSGTDQTEFQVSSLIVGNHALHAVYGGDTAYTGSKSAVLAQTISPTATQGPDLVGTLLSTTLPATLAPGESGTIRVQITNQGNTPASAVIENAAYLSLDNTVDPGSVALTLRGALARTRVRLKAGQSEILTGTVTVPQNTPLAGYQLLVQLNSTGSLLESVTTNNTVVSPTTYAVSDVFGTVAGRAGVLLNVADNNGTPALFRLTGPGSGAVNIGDAGVQIVLTGTTAASVLTITSPRGSALFTASDLTDTSAIGSIRAPGLSVTNTLALSGSAGSITLGSLGATMEGTFTLGTGVAPVINITNVVGMNLGTSGGIKSLTVGNWESGTIYAGWIGTLLARRDFNAVMYVGGSGDPGGFALKSATIRGTASRAWSAIGNVGRISITTTAPVANSWSFSSAGLLQSLSLGSSFYGGVNVFNIGTMQVRGDLNDALISTAANFNSLIVTGNLINTHVLAAEQAAGTLGSVRVTGGSTGSTIGAGVGGVTGLNPDIPPNGLGTIKAITVLGAVDANTRFLAANLPIHAVLGGKRVVPATDPHFAASAGTI